MRRVDGKTALILLVEEEMGFHDFNETETRQLREQVKSLFMFLMKQGHSEYDVQEILDHIKEDTRKELQVDWPDAFRMAEGRAQSDMELESSAMMQTLDSETNTNKEFWDGQRHEKKIETIAFLASERPDWNRFSRAIEHMGAIEGKIELLEKVKEHQNNQLSNIERQAVKIISRELDWLRFGKSKGRKFKKICSCHGDGIYISVGMWKKMRNRINALLDVEKRYKVKEFEKTERDDILDDAVYGYDLDNF